MTDGAPAVQPRDKLAPCPVTGCSDLVTAGFIMCREHWMKVPAETRVRLWGAYYAWRTSRRTADEDRLRQLYATLRSQACREANPDALELPL